MPDVKESDAAIEKDRAQAIEGFLQGEIDNIELEIQDLDRRVDKLKEKLKTLRELLELKKL